MVDNTPKLITKVQAIIPILPLKNFAISVQPLVISIRPSSTPTICVGKMEKIGFNAVIITKNIAIIAPTDNMLNIESKMIDARSVEGFSFEVRAVE